MKRFIHPRFLIFFLALVAIVAAFWLSGAYRYIQLDRVADYRDSVEELVALHPLLSGLIFMGIVAISSIIIVPIGVFIAILGGFFFDQPWSTIYVVVGATLGETILYFVGRGALAHFLVEQAGERLERIKAEIAKNGKEYLLMLRLALVFPGWLVTFAAAIFRIPIWTLIWTTAVGFIPSCFVYTQLGEGLGDLLELEGPISTSDLFNPHMKIALISLSIIAIFVIAYRLVRRRSFF